MLLINLKTSIRSLLKNRSYALLNLLGLTSGLIVFMLIILYTSYEFSYDRHLSKLDRIVRVYKEDNGNYYKGTNKYAVVPTPLAPTMKLEYPEVEEFFHIDYYNNAIMRVGDEPFLEKKVHVADPGIFKILDLELIRGNQETVLVGNEAAAISESVAMRLFNRTDVVGEVFKFRDEIPFQITGVFKDMPKNSHFTVSTLLNFEGLMKAIDRRMDRWDNSSYYSFLLLKEGADMQALEDKLPELRAKYADDPVDEDGQESIYYLQAMKDVHFTKEVNFDIAPSANLQQLYIYVGVAFMILVIACINYVNLATARAINRTKEIGIRKVIGARPRNLIFNTMVESGILVSVALVLSVLGLILLVPAFSTFIDKELTLDLNSSQFWIMALGLGLGVTILSGIYPAVMLTKFKPIASLKGKTKQGNGFLRNGLVVFQFTISCMLIFGASILSKQLSFIENMDVGFEKDQIVVLGIRDRGLRDKLDIFKEELRRIPGVKYVSSSNSLPNNISSNGTVNWLGKPEGEDVVLYTNTADHDFAKLYGLELVQGRDFDRSIASDDKAILINESAVKALGWDEPLGKQIMRWWGDTGVVVGVLKDFHAHNLRLGIEPIQIFQRSGQFNVSIKVDGAEMKNAIAAIESTYEQFDPVHPFDYNYFDDIFDRAYKSDMQTAKLANWFTVLAIVIACLGLYGLAAHKVQHRIKEVGVRKVLGASVQRILFLLSKDFGILLTVSFFIAAPVAFYFMDSWLNDFAYHTNINVFSFLLVFVLMILVAGVTVGFKTYRAATSNPVETLRDE